MLEVPEGKRGTAAVAEKIELDAVIRWFDPKKGYGFVTSETVGDIFLHGSRVIKSGFITLGSACEGTPIRVEAAKGERGWFCTRIISLQKSDRRPERSSRIRVEKVVGPYHLRVKWFNRQKGFGFFERSSGPDIFVHNETLRMSGLLVPIHQGEYFDVTYGVDENDPQRGLKAVSVKAV